MTLIINGTDFSNYIQQETDISETMRKIVGPAQDTAVDGTDILDLLKVKWDPSFLLKPMPQAQMAQLISMMELEKVTLTYTSVVSGELRQDIDMQPLSMTVKYAMTTANGVRIYADTPISFQEV